MKRLALLAALVVSPQDDIGKQIARVTEQDAPFDAIARLVEMDAGKVRAAAERIQDPFYRTALLEELTSRDRCLRASIEAKEEAPASVLASLAARAKLRIGTQWAFGGPVEPISVTANDVPVLAALQAVCREAKLRIMPTWGVVGALTLVEGEGLGSEWQYRNFLVRPESAVRRRQTDFGAAPAEYVLLKLVAAADSASSVIAIERAEILEAIDDQGRAAPVVPWRDDDPAPPSRVTVRPAGTVVTLLTLNAVRLRPQSGAKKLARVRGFLVTRVPTETSRLAVDLVTCKVASDALVAVAVEGMSLRLTPRKGTAEELLKIPMELIVKTAEGDETRLTAIGGVRDGVLEIMGPPGAWGEANDGRDLESVTLLMHKGTVVRKVYFELRDVAVE